MFIEGNASVPMQGHPMNRSGSMARHRRVMPRMRLLAALLATNGLLLAGSAMGASAQGQVNVICSVQADWCNNIATIYSRTTGTRKLPRSGSAGPGHI